MIEFQDDIIQYVERQTKNIKHGSIKVELVVHDGRICRMIAEATPKNSPYKVEKKYL